VLFLWLFCSFPKSIKKRRAFNPEFKLTGTGQRGVSQCCTDQSELKYHFIDNQLFNITARGLSGM